MAFLVRCDRCLRADVCTYQILLTTEQRVTTCFFACKNCIRKAWVVGLLVDESMLGRQLDHRSTVKFSVAVQISEAMGLSIPFFAWWGSNEWRILYLRPGCHPAIRKSNARVVREWLYMRCDWTQRNRCTFCDEAEGFGMYRASMQTPFAFACCRCINLMIVLSSRLVQEFGDVPFDYVMISNGDEAVVMYAFGSVDLLYWLNRTC